VMMHGCGQSADDFAIGTGMNRIADEFGFLVLYPEQSPSANFGRCWNWHRAGDQKRDAGEPAMIAALVRHIAGLCKANPERIYIAGMSAGAAIAAITAKAYPEMFVALGVHSGLTAGTITTVSGALAAMRDGGAGASGRSGRAPVPTIVFHGDQDRTVNPANARGFLDRLSRSSRLPLLTRVKQGRSSGGRDFTRTSHADAKGTVMLEDWVVHGSGHAWSGGTGPVRIPIRWVRMPRAKWCASFSREGGVGSGSLARPPLRTPRAPDRPG
ncbi:MAG: esterase, depolymerase family protein, partial [Rhizorhabdus sp.]|nr:esterase, depolymerase family protein [Rhizorhabdus sp.]